MAPLKVVPLPSKDCPPSPPLPKLRPSGARLLSCDGGGCKGISSVMILDTIMERVKAIEIEQRINISTDARRPCDYFDLAAGTSTGGLIALMLFRLEMNTKQCLEAYRDLAKQIFAPTLLGIIKMPGGFIGKASLGINLIASGALFYKEPLEKAIKQIITKYSDSDDKWKDFLVNPNKRMMFMCATLRDLGESVLLRSYRRPEDAQSVSAPIVDMDEVVDSIDIVSAARATSAAPVYLPPEEWQYQKDKISFWDGGVLNNNPIEQLWNARYDLVERNQPPPKVSCVVSFGCGKPDPTPPSFLSKVIDTAIIYENSFLANTEAKHADFERFSNRLTERGDQNNDLKYFRFNAPTGKTKIDMADYTQMDILVKLTQTYINGEEGRKQIEECARLLASRD